MGVPRLFPWICQTFPEAKLSFFKGEWSTSVDWAYLDASGILHSANQRIHHYGSNVTPIDMYAKYTPEEKQIASFELIFDTMVFITTIVRPKKGLYIAIDGPAPRGKQAQQRQRRATASHDRPEGFDSNCLSPGTEYMFELTKYLHFHIRRRMETDAAWRKLDVVFSPPSVPGEGEHSCLNFMRRLPDAEKLTHCIYGPDGDLIMLTLSIHLPHIFLLREDQYNPDHYDYVDMGFVRKSLPKVVAARGLDDVSNDFILAGFFVGNDFLPKIQMFMFLEDGLELMINTYSRLYRSHKLTLNNQICHPGFTRFIEELSRREKMYLEDQLSKPVPDARFTNHTLLKHSKQDAKTGKYSVSMKDYRRDYYAKSGIDSSDEAAVTAQCIDYLRSIAWVFHYYVSGLPSWTYCYEWHYAPLMTDLWETMKALEVEDLASIYTFTTDDMGAPNLPFVHLLTVLPRPSESLLPEEFRSILTSEKSELRTRGYLPDTLEIDYEGKTKEHMAVIKLPFVNVGVVKKAYDKIQQKAKYGRNQVGKEETFRYDPSYNASYVSDYGKLELMHIRKLC